MRKIISETIKVIRFKSGPPTKADAKQLYTTRTSKEKYRSQSTLEMETISSLHIHPQASTINGFPIYTSTKLINIPTMRQKQLSLFIMA